MAYSPSLEQLEADTATAKQNVKEERDDCRMHPVASHATEDFMQLTDRPPAPRFCSDLCPGALAEVLNNHIPSHTSST